MKADFRLLIPALGIWAGAFLQSLLFGANSVVHILFLLTIVGLIWRARTNLAGVFLSAFLVGALLLSIHQSALHREFFEARSGQVVKVSAHVTGDVRRIDGKIRGDTRQPEHFLIDVKSISVDGKEIRVPLLLFGEGDSANLVPGEELEFLGRIQIFTGYATVAGSLTQVGSLKRVGSASRIWRWTSSIRSDVKSSLAPLPDDARALIPGLVIGDRSGQGHDLTLAMRRSGLTHLTAVSGANFAIVAALLLLIGRTLRIRGKFLWISIGIFLMVFIFLVRPSSSVLRAAVMTGVLLFAKSRGLRSSPIPALAVAISLLLLINPFYVRDAGFALSVSATAGLLFLAPILSKWFELRGFHEVLAEALAIPLSATLLCLPIIVLLSGELSLISIAANFLVAPVIAVITGCGVALMILAPISSGLGTLVGWFITPFTLWITFVARRMSGLPFAALKWPQSWTGSLAVFIVIVLVTIAIRRKMKVTALVCCVVMIISAVLTLTPFSRSWVPEDWQIFQCDVGQGDGMVIKIDVGRAILIDAGPDSRTIDKCLKLLKVQRIDLLILTHFHADHVSGLAGALKGRKVERVWISPTKEPSSEADQVVKILGEKILVIPRIGDRFATGNVVISVVAVAAHSTPNDSSISILANINGTTLFAAGDLEIEGQGRVLTSLERWTPNHIWDRKEIDVMKGIHHGSALQDPRLIGFLRPRVTFFSVGSENPYGHPSQLALDLYGRYGAVYRTDRDRSLALANRGGTLIVVLAPPSPWAD